MAKGKTNGGELTFETLVEAASQGIVSGDLLKRKGDLEAERATAQERLQKINDELKEIDQTLQTPIRAGMKAAAALGIAIPDKYKSQTRNHNANGTRQEGRWTAKVGGRTINMKNLGYLAAHLTAACNGPNRDGRLTSDGLLNLIVKVTGREDIPTGQVFQVDLPNGKTMEVKKETA